MNAIQFYSEHQILICRAFLSENRYTLFKLLVQSSSNRTCRKHIHQSKALVILINVKWRRKPVVKNEPRNIVTVRFESKDLASNEDKSTDTLFDSRHNQKQWNQ